MTPRAAGAAPPRLGRNLLTRRQAASHARRGGRNALPRSSVSCGRGIQTLQWKGSPAEVYSGGRNFGHLAYRVDDIYKTCQRLAEGGVIINRPPRDGHMAFVRSPDGISIELLQAGPAKAPAEPWVSAPNIGTW